MKGLSLGVGGFGGWSHTVHSSVLFQCLEAGEPPPNCVRSGRGSSEPTHHGYVPALEELCLFVHRQSSYKLLLIMVMYLGPAHISICSPVPPDFWAPSILRTAVPTAGACDREPVSLLFLLPFLPAPACGFRHGILFLSALVRLSPPSGCGHGWDETVWTTWRSSPP